MLLVPLLSFIIVCSCFVIVVVVVFYLISICIDPIPEFTTYGYLSGYDENIQDSLIVISKDDTKREGIQDTSILFEKVKDGLSRIYLFNAMKKVGTNKGKSSFISPGVLLLYNFLHKNIFHS